MILLLIPIISVIIVLSTVGRSAVNRILSEQAKAVVIDIVNDSNEVLQKMDVFYSDYFTVHYDGEGSVDSVSANTGLINQMNMILQTDVQNRLDAFHVLSTELPFGALTGSAVLSGFGLRIPIRAQVVGTCYTELRSEFSALGINNTLHRLQINCLVELRMIVPNDTFVDKVTNEILLAETVISGKVPNTYLGDSAMADYFDLIPD